ncbi:MAG: CHAD domain-containing protein [Myxococcaceae bacterium]
MAKARPLPGLTADTPLKDAATAILLTRADEVADALSDFLDDESATSLHACRTSIRRFRTAVEAFAAPVPEDVRGPASKQLKKLFKALGKARDVDVGAELLGRGAPRLREELESKRERRYRRARKATKKFLRKNVLPELRSAVTDHLVLRADPLPEPYAQRTLREGADAVLTPLTDALLKRIKDANEKRDVETLHQLRLAVKQERDALEMLSGALPVLGSWQKRLAQIATVLGDLHDLDVMDERVSKRMDDGAGKKTRKELERVEGKLKEQRDRLHAEADARISAKSLQKLSTELKDARAHAFFAPVVH